MEFGCCAPAEKASTLAGVADYVELPVAATLGAEKNEEAVERVRKALAEAGVPASAGNVFLPPSLKVTGPERDMTKLEGYVRTVCARAERFGMKVIAFGSGGARTIPEGYPREAGLAEIVKFLRMAGETAAGHGMEIAIEPLREAESNAINTLGEALALCGEVGQASVGVLADIYHMVEAGEPFSILEEARGALVHVHVAEPPGRKAPTRLSGAVAQFLQALKAAGYDRRISIECLWEDIKSEAPKAVGVVRGGWVDGGTP